MSDRSKRSKRLRRQLKGIQTPRAQCYCRQQMSIFSTQPSGYSTKKPEVDQPSRIVEIMRGAIGKTGG